MQELLDGLADLLFRRLDPTDPVGFLKLAGAFLLGVNVSMWNERRRHG